MIELDYGVRLITRDEWGARAPRSVTRLATSLVTSHWGGPGFAGDDWPHESCYSKVRGWQNFHMDGQGWSDLAYNAVGCQHRFVFEGRGQGVRSAANGTAAGNSGAFAVCYLGGIDDPFDEDAKAAMKAAGNWLAYPGSPRNGHRDWKLTGCPGDVIYGWTHDGQPVIWTPGTPPPTTPIGADSMLFLVKGNGGSPAEYITNLDWKFHMRNPEERNWFLWTIRAGGGAIATNPDNTAMEWAQADVDNFRTTSRT